METVSQSQTRRLHIIRSREVGEDVQKKTRGACVAPSCHPRRGQAGLLADLFPSASVPCRFVHLLPLCAWLLPCCLSVTRGTDWSPTVTGPPLPGAGCWRPSCRPRAASTRRRWRGSGPRWKPSRRSWTSSSRASARRSCSPRRPRWSLASSRSYPGSPTRTW